MMPPTPAGTRCRVSTEIPITVQGNIGRLGQQISTKLGRGGATIRAHTTNGPLSIHGR